MNDDQITMFKNSARTQRNILEDLDTSMDRIIESERQMAVWSYSSIALTVIALAMVALIVT